MQHLLYALNCIVREDPCRMISGLESNMEALFPREVCTPLTNCRSALLGEGNQEWSQFVACVPWQRAVSMYSIPWSSKLALHLLNVLFYSIFSLKQRDLRATCHLLLPRFLVIMDSVLINSLRPDYAVYMNDIGELLPGLKNAGAFMLSNGFICNIRRIMDNLRTLSDCNNVVPWCPYKTTHLTERCKESQIWCQHWRPTAVCIGKSCIKCQSK